MHMPTPNFSPFLSNFVEMSAWIDSRENGLPLPIYSSVDIRESDVKSVVVDTNLFPAGFNNISRSDWAGAIDQFKRFITSHVPTCRNVLIIAEEHTRNKWYVDHLVTLESLIKSAGFEVESATFLNPKTDQICHENHWITLESASFGDYHIRCLSHALRDFENGTRNIDLIIYNNDLSEGLPERLKGIEIPCHPSPLAGWYARKKSTHFSFMADVIGDFSAQFKFDPWLITSLFSSFSQADINQESDRQSLFENATRLYGSIQEKYDHYQIAEKPCLFLKADSGTYGMGVIPVAVPEEILTLNRKARNNLSKGKSSIEITDFIIQEGVPTALNVSGCVAETCIYLANNQVVGAFYRLNDIKSASENLNSQGMRFEPISITEFKAENPQRFALYTILARLAGLACGLEIQALQTPG